MKNPQSVNKWKPVPKIAASVVGGLATALAIALFAYFGVEQEAAKPVAQAFAAFVVALLPVLGGAVAGYLKTDTERGQLLSTIAGLESLLLTSEDGGRVFREVLEYVGTLDESE